jgi:glycerophosphoryl diester phosphodiesterase
MTKLQQRLTLGLMATALLALLLVPGGAGASSGSASVAGRDKHAKLPIVIGHRGASGYRPEHTLASYQLAIEMGADYIEPDLVSTKDHVLVARHENNIKDTTNVADHPEFADREATKVIDGVSVSGWFTEDFTLAELMTLRAKERLPAVRPANTAFDGLYQVPTFQQVIDLAKRRHVGIYPETKHPTYFRKQGLALEPKLVEALNRNGLNHLGAKVFVQSFEVSNLKVLRHQLRVPLIQLTSATGAPFDFTDTGDPRTYADIVSAAGLREVATYADGIGPDKLQVIPSDAAGNLTTPTALVRDAHAAHLQVHPYTFRAENTFLPANLRSSDVPTDYGNLFAEITAYFTAGVDGVFTDNSDIGIATRTEFHA